MKEKALEILYKVGLATLSGLCLGATAYWTKLLVKDLSN